MKTPPSVDRSRLKKATLPGRVCVTVREQKNRLFSCPSRSVTSPSRIAQHKDESQINVNAENDLKSVNETKKFSVKSSTTRQ